MPEVQVQEVVRHAPMLTTGEHARHVPRVLQQVEKIVADPPHHKHACRPFHVQTVEKIVEVPGVHVQEVFRQGPKLMASGDQACAMSAGAPGGRDRESTARADG